MGFSEGLKNELEIAVLNFYCTTDNSSRKARAINQILNIWKDKSKQIMVFTSLKLPTKSWLSQFILYICIDSVSK